jgi:methylmalonyl-CoA mutase C-terminal domain/subunit
MLLSPEQVVEAAVQEDVDAIGLSILSGAHMSLMERILELLKEHGAHGTPVFLGGIIPDKDIARLKQMGVTEVYLPDTPVDSIVDSIRQHLVTKEGRKPQSA